MVTHDRLFVVNRDVYIDVDLFYLANKDIEFCSNCLPGMYKLLIPSHFLYIVS